MEDGNVISAPDFSSPGRIYFVLWLMEIPYMATGGKNQ